MVEWEQSFHYLGWVSVFIPLLSASIFLWAVWREGRRSGGEEEGGDLHRVALEKGLDKTRRQFWNPLAALLGERGKLSGGVLEEVEEILYGADLGPKLTKLIIQQLREHVGREAYGLQQLKGFLREIITSKIAVEGMGSPWGQDQLVNSLSGELQTVMVVGVNGVGKTTSVGKLATKLTGLGAKVVVGACDTFRMAAGEQLEVWVERAGEGCEIVRAKHGADPSGVAYDTLKRAREVQANYCLMDTAGRLHTKSNLMDELQKTKRVLGKLHPQAPQHVWLVIDAVTGQNAMHQAREFHQALGLTGLVLTKCDGSSKAGAAVSIVESLQVPIIFIGVGEGVDDLQYFNAGQYVNAMLLC